VASPDPGEQETLEISFESCCNSRALLFISWVDRTDLRKASTYSKVRRG
jgi:hypothetical protein